MYVCNEHYKQFVIVAILKCGSLENYLAKESW